MRVSQVTLLQEYMARSAAAHPDKTALVFKKQRFTWAEVHAQAGRIASSLKELGLKFDFYLTHQMKNPAYDAEWRLYHPADF